MAIQNVHLVVFIFFVIFLSFFLPLSFIVIIINFFGGDHLKRREGSSYATGATHQIPPAPTSPP